MEPVAVSYRPIELKYSVPFVATTIFGFFTLIVYLVIIKTLVQHRKMFNTVYYKFFLISAILCIISYVDSWPILILPNVVCKNCTFSGFYEQETFPGINVLRFLYAYVNHTINYIEILMVFNRYTAIAFHFNYADMWHRFSYYPLILVFIIPLALTFPSTYAESFAYYKEEFDSYAIRSDESILRRKITAALSMLILTLSVCIFGGMTLFALYKNPVFSGRSVELKLFIHAAINAGNGIFSFIYGTLTAFFPVTFHGMNESLVMEYILLVNTCISPYIFIMCSKPLRDRLPLLSIWKRTIPAREFHYNLNPKPEYGSFYDENTCKNLIGIEKVFGYHYRPYNEKLFDVIRPDGKPGFRCCTSKYPKFCKTDD